MAASDDDWISLTEAAELLSVSRLTVYRTLVDPGTADRIWGAKGWKLRPTRRKIYRVRRTRAEQIVRLGGLGAVS